MLPLKPLPNISKQGWSLPWWSRLKCSNLTSKPILFRANIRAGCKWFTVTSALAYNAIRLITSAKSFILQAPELITKSKNVSTVCKCYKTFFWL